MRNRKGFTLVEVIVVLVILAILAAVLVPSMIKWIANAEKKSMITNCRACVLASQTLLSEDYAVAGSSADIDKDKAVALAGMDGSINSVTWDSRYQISHLTYEENGFTVEFCADGGCSVCANTDTYTVNSESTEGSGGGAVESPEERLQAEADSTFTSAGTTFAGFNYTGDTIDGFNAGAANTKANTIYNALTDTQKAFLDSVSWTIRKTPNGYRMFFSETNHGTESVSNIRVYKYDFETGQYQYSDKGFIKDGSVSGLTDFGDWSDTMENFRK